MTLTPYERETIINFSEGDDKAIVFTYNNKLKNRLGGLALSHPDACEFIRNADDGQAVEFRVPKTWIKVNPPRELSDEQRAAAAERLARLRNRQD